MFNMFFKYKIALHRLLFAYYSCLFKKTIFSFASLIKHYIYSLQEMQRKVPKINVPKTLYILQQNEVLIFCLITFVSQYQEGAQQRSKTFLLKMTKHDGSGPQPYYFCYLWIPVERCRCSCFYHPHCFYLETKAYFFVSLV